MSKYIKIHDNACLPIQVDLSDCNLVEDFDSETGEEYLSGFVSNRWVGYFPKTATTKDVAERVWGEVQFWSAPTLECVLTDSERVFVVTLLRRAYQEIVDKLDADIAHNPRRAHHQGTWGNGLGIDRAAVIRSIETFLAKN